MEKSDIIEEIDFGNDSDDPNYKPGEKLNKEDLDFKEVKKNDKPTNVN